MTRPPKLPVRINFPVYGLDSRYTGPRNLVMWNQPDYLWTVTLTHGGLLSGSWLSVETIRKQPRPAQTSAELPQEPVGLDSAAFHALIKVVDQEPARGRDARDAPDSLLNAELALIEIDDDAQPPLVHLRDWDETTTAIDGQSMSACWRAIAASQVMVVDLPDVVLSVTATGEFDVNQIHRTDVRTRLADYPWPSVRGHMRARRDPPPSPQHPKLLPLHLGLIDILANAKDNKTDPTELLARIEHVADHLLHGVLAKIDQDSDRT